MAGGSPCQSVRALCVPAGLWAEEVGRVSATRKDLGAEVASLRRLVEELRAEGKPTGTAQLQLVATTLETVVDRLASRYLGSSRPSLTLIRGGRDGD